MACRLWLFRAVNISFFGLNLALRAVYLAALLFLPFKVEWLLLSILVRYLFVFVLLFVLFLPVLFSDVEIFKLQLGLQFTAGRAFHGSAMMGSVVLNAMVVFSLLASLLLKHVDDVAYWALMMRRLERIVVMVRPIITGFILAFFFEVIILVFVRILKCWAWLHFLVGVLRRGSRLHNSHHIFSTPGRSLCILGPWLDFSFGLSLRPLFNSKRLQFVLIFFFLYSESGASALGLRLHSRLASTIQHAILSMSTSLTSSVLNCSLRCIGVLLNKFWSSLWECELNVMSLPVSLSTKARNTWLWQSTASSMAFFSRPFLRL